MLRTLLIDRFKLQIEKEQKTGTISVLTVDPGGAKLKKSNDTTGEPQTNVSAQSINGAFDLVLDATNVTISRFTFTSPFWELRAPVVDATGLDDTYDIHWVLGNPAEVSPMDPANIIETCKRQLGLKLSDTKGQIDIINVTHVERPTQN